jgi:hypothetical protein
MKRVCVIPAVTCLLSLVNGCGLSGTWRTVDVAPTGEQFPIASVTFDRAGKFTASSGDHGDRRTSTGAFKWNGFRLLLRPTDAPEQVYRGRFLVGGRLSLAHKASRTRATLVRLGAE